MRISDYIRRIFFHDEVMECRDCGHKEIGWFASKKTARFDIGYTCGNCLKDESYITPHRGVTVEECLTAATQALNIHSAILLKQMTNEARLQDGKAMAYGEDSFDADWRYLSDLHRQCCSIRKRLGIAESNLPEIPDSSEGQ